MQAVKERAENVQQQAENVTDAKSAPNSKQEKAAASVGKKMVEAAPEQHLQESLSVVQGAESDLQDQKQPQVHNLSNIIRDASCLLMLSYAAKH